jgi:hypothetical protein
MIKEAIDRILELSTPNLSEVCGCTYSDKKLYRIDEDIRNDDAIQMNTLKGLVDYIKNTDDFKASAKPYIVQIVSPTEVQLISSLDYDRKRETLVRVKAVVPEFEYGRFLENEKFIINVQAKFIDAEHLENDKPTILAFAGNVKAGTVAEYGDTGVGQKAAIRRGVSSLQQVEVPSPCQLIPYRTFTEVEQPMSRFIFRVKDDDRLGVQCALFEADGGAWQNGAKENIKNYLTSELSDFDNQELIIVS